MKIGGDWVKIGSYHLTCMCVFSHVHSPGFPCHCGCVSMDRRPPVASSADTFHTRLYWRSHICRPRSERDWQTESGDSARQRGRGWQQWAPSEQQKPGSNYFGCNVSEASLSKTPPEWGMLLCVHNPAVTGLWACTWTSKQGSIDGAGLFLSRHTKEIKEDRGTKGDRNNADETQEQRNQRRRKLGQQRLYLIYKKCV